MTIHSPIAPAAARAVRFESIAVARQRPVPGRTGALPIGSEAIELLDLAQLRFVNCLVRCGLSLDEAGAVVAAELRILRSPPRRRLATLSGCGTRLVPV